MDPVKKGEKSTKREKSTNEEKSTKREKSKKATSKNASKSNKSKKATEGDVKEATKPMLINARSKASTKVKRPYSNFSPVYRLEQTFAFGCGGTSYQPLSSFLALSV